MWLYFLTYIINILTLYLYNVLRHEICQYLEELSGEPVAGQADEPEARITVTGKYAYFIREFLYEKGF